MISHEKRLLADNSHVGHRPVIVKRAVIGSKGGLIVEAQHNIFKLWGVSWLVNNKTLYLLDGYIWNNISLLLLIKFTGVA